VSNCHLTLTTGANIKYVVTTLHSAIKMGFFDKIDNDLGSNIIKKVLQSTYRVVLQRVDAVGWVTG